MPRRVAGGWGLSTKIHIRECPACGDLRVTTSLAGRKSCSDECAATFSQSVHPPEVRAANRRRDKVQRKRRRVFGRDDYVCQLCGKVCHDDPDVLDDDKATVDHIVPRALGGGDHMNNLQTACWHCNVIVKGDQFMGYMELAYG